MDTNSNLHIEGRIDTKSYDESQLPDNWDELSDKEKLDATRELEPVEENTSYNVTVEGMHTYFAQNLDPGQTVAEDVSHLAVGDDDATTPASTDSTLNNEVFRKTVTDHSQNGNELLASTYIDSSEANGYTLKEVGLFAGPDTADRMWNHSLIADIVKDSTRTITIDVTLTFSAA